MLGVKKRLNIRLHAEIVTCGKVLEAMINQWEIMHPE
jgi:hypothetical protein